jgi:hypothetical protein
LYQLSDVGDATEVVGELQDWLTDRYSCACAVIVTEAQVPLEQLRPDTEETYPLVNRSLRVPFPFVPADPMVYGHPEFMVTT